jgi:histidinol-phosphate aminotransferase
MLNSHSRKAPRLVRPLVEKLHAYVPGEQPKIKGLIKLNTNENPYGPAPKVLVALRSAATASLRLYPNPTAERLRQKLAQLHQCEPENIIVGNGSDELLALATRAFVEPLTGLTHYALENARSNASIRNRIRPSDNNGSDDALNRSRYTVQFFHPSYSLYPVLADIHGARPKPISLPPDFSLPSWAELQEKHWDPQAALTYVTTPNAPSGRGYTRAELSELCARHQGVIVLDEAYVDFARESAMELALEYPHVLVSRTFSKAYALCALRVGYCVGSAELISALHKVRDSYNVNAMGQVAAEATLSALPYYKKNFRRIISSREQLSEKLAGFGFEVFPSQTNFILTRPPRFPAEVWLARLRERKVLVRWFSQPEVREYLRITIGSETEMAALVRAVGGILRD